MNALSRMKLLISLAKVDGQVADKEKNHIINIGRANGIYPDEIYPLFTQTHPMAVPENLPDDQKFELLVSLIQLMKLDERMYREEIQFCALVAQKLGYDRNVMFELLAHVKAAGMGAEEIESLKKLTQEFLNRNAQ